MAQGAGGAPPSGGRLGKTLVQVAIAVVFGLGSLACGDGEDDTQPQRSQPPSNIIVVGIDEETLLEREWPFPRSLHAKVIDRLHDDGAKVIVYDVQFTEQTEEKEDLALFDAADRAGNLVFATTEVNPGGSTNVLGGDDNLESIDAVAGNSTLPEEPGGVRRTLAYSLDGLMLLAVVAAERATGKPVDRELFDDKEWIDFAGGPGSMRVVPFSRVLAGEVPPGTFRDKIVVVGATAPSLKDTFRISKEGDEMLSGPEIQAHAIDTVLRGLPRDGPWDGEDG